MFQPSTSQLTPQIPLTRALSFPETSTPKLLNWGEHGGTPGGETQNGGFPKEEQIATYTQIQNDELQRLGRKIKHHEENLKFLRSQVDNLDESIFDMQVNLGKYHSSSGAVVKSDNTNNLTEENTVDQILQQEKSAAGVLCQLKSRHGILASKLPFTKGVLGIVAILGKVEDDNLSRLFSEYLGLETMMAIVCNTYEGVKALEAYDQEGSIKKDVGLHGLGPSIGRHMEGRFLTICLENLRPFAGEFIANDPQRRLALLKPRLPNGECPSGFLGFAVNMFNLENANLSCLTAAGHGLRETLFYNLFSRLQVYKTRREMLLALPCISDGAVSLDGGIIKTSGIHYLGNREEVQVRFPVSAETSVLPAHYVEAEQRIKFLKWDKERVQEDIQREDALLEHVTKNFCRKKDEFLKFAAESSAYLNQSRAQMSAPRTMQR